MADKRKIESFSAGCALCDETVERVIRVACPSCEVEVLDLRQADVARRARQLGVRGVPAVVVDGNIADGCAGRGADEAFLRATGMGTPK